MNKYLKISSDNLKNFKSRGSLSDFAELEKRKKEIPPFKCLIPLWSTLAYLKENLFHFQIRLRLRIIPTLAFNSRGLKGIVM